LAEHRGGEAGVGRLEVGQGAGGFDECSTDHPLAERQDLLSDGPGAAANQAGHRVDCLPADDDGLDQIVVAVGQKLRPLAMTSSFRAGG